MPVLWRDRAHVLRRADHDRGIAPSYGPKTVSAVPNAAAIVRRIWLPELDAGYDPQGLRLMMAPLCLRLSQRQLGRPSRAVPLIEIAQALREKKVTAQRRWSPSNELGSCSNRRSCAVPC